MPEIRFQASAHLVENIGEYIGDTRGTRVGQAALQFANWAVNEMNQGRQIQSVGDDGQIHTPVMFFTESQGPEGEE